MTQKVLILTNESSYLESINKTLSNAYFLVSLEDPSSVIQYLDINQDVRALIIDIDTHNMVVEQLLETLSVHAMFRNIKTIVLAHPGDEKRVVSLLNKGVNDFLLKPINGETLKILLDLHMAISDASMHSSDTNIIFNRLFFDAPIGVSISRTRRLANGELIESIVINPAYEKIVGRDRNYLLNHHWQEYTHPDDLEDGLDLFHKLETGEIKSYNRYKRYIKEDGTIVWVNLIVSSFDRIDPETFSYISIIQDITYERETSLKLGESERSKSVLLGHLPGLAYRTKYDRDWTMLFVSQGCLDLTGYEPDDLLFNKRISYKDIIDPSHHDSLWEEWEKVIANKTSFHYEYQIITKAGKKKWVLELGEPIYDKDGAVIALEGIVIDISYSKKIEFELQHRIDFDPVTELHNRSYFEVFLTKELSNKQKKSAIVELNFSAIQSLMLSNGYHYAVDLIKKIASILKPFTNDRIELFSTHENRFCFYFHDYKGKEELITFYEKLCEKLEAILLLERIFCGVGFVEIRLGFYNDVDRLLKDVLIASEKALTLENDRLIDYVFFDEDMIYQIEREKIIKEELIEVVEKGRTERIFLHFQPVIDLKTNKVSSFEALARFRSDKFGVISPLEFIPLLEKTKLIVPIGEIITMKSLTFLKRIHGLGYSEIMMSINISPLQLLSDNFADIFVKMLQALDVDTRKVWIEITESIFTNNYQLVNRILGDIMALGVRVFIDDFGTGYSSLHRVLALNIKGIKIDRAFINGLELIPEDIAITKDIVSLGHKLNYLVVAEGIENEVQLNYLKAYDCDYGQGYYFSRPLEEDKALLYLRKVNGN